MLWEVEILPLGHDAEADRVKAEFTLLRGAAGPAGAVPPDIRLGSRGFLLEGELTRQQAESLLNELLLDPLVELDERRLQAQGEARPHRRLARASQPDQRDALGACGSRRRAEVAELRERDRERLREASQLEHAHVRPAGLRIRHVPPAGLRQPSQVGDGEACNQAGLLQAPPEFQKNGLVRKLVRVMIRRAH